MANVTKAYDAKPQRMDIVNDLYYTIVESGASIYKGSLAVVLTDDTGITFGENTASAIFKGVAADTKLEADGTERVGHYVNGVFEFSVEGSTVAVDDEVYIGSDPNTVQMDTSTGPKCGRVVRYISATKANISIDGYAD